MEAQKHYDYDELITILTPFLKFAINPHDKEAKSKISLPQVKGGINQPSSIGDRIEQTIKLVELTKKSEKGIEKQDILKDLSSFLNLMKYNFTNQNSTYHALTYSLWANAPRWLIDNRQPKELAQDILSKAEKINQKQALIEFAAEDRVVKKLG